MKKIVQLLVLTIVFVAKAQETKKSFTYSLEEAINYALDHNYTAINSNRDIEIAKKKKWETTAIGLPQINGSLNYLKNIDFTLQGVSGNAFNPAGNPNDIALFAFGTKHVMTSNLNLSQLIFDGSYLVGLQASKVYLKISENAKQKTNQELREIVTNAYGNVLLAQESVLILEKNKTILDKILKDTREILKNGLIEEENVEQLQITLAGVNNSLQYSKRLQTITTNMLKLILGIELDENIQLTDSLTTLTQNSFEMAITKDEFKLSNNIDYQISKNAEESKKLLLKLEKSRSLPSLGAQLNFGYNSFSNSFTFTDTDQKWNKFTNLGVGLNVPVFSSFRNDARIQQAKIAYEQSKTQTIETEQKLKLEYQRTKSDYEFSLENYSTSKENLKLAERIEAKQQIKFLEGLSTSFDYADAQKQLYSNQQDYLKSMVDVINKKAALEKILNKN